MLHLSHIFERFATLFFELFKMTGRQAGDFFELIRQMSNAAIVHFVGYFGEIQLVIHDELFYLFNLMLQVEIFNSGALDFTKKIGEIGIIEAEFFTKMIR